VKDTGWGIPQSQQAKVFTKLFRADNVLNSEVISVGLGLHLVKLMVTGLGGKIWFESKENQGSTFYVELPNHKG
jgi:signal transduction histidine kinase